MRTVTITVVGLVALLTGCSATEPVESPAASSSPIVATQAPTVRADPDDALAAAVQIGDAAAVASALAAGADPDLDLGSRVSALVAAVQRDDAAIVEALVLAGADVEMPNGEGRTPLMVAGQYSGAEVIAALLAGGAKVDSFSTDVYNASPLHAAAQGRNPVALEALLASGVDVDLVNPDYGATALHAAAYWNCAECAMVLYSAGADLAAVEHGGETPLQVARERGATETALFLEAMLAPE